MEINEIYEIIKENEIINISELIEKTTISESTIRRKLKILENNGLIKLKHGGIIQQINKQVLSASDEYRLQLNEYHKILIAKKAAEYVKKDDVIFLDNGTTVRKMFGYLKDKRITVYTNGYNHIAEAEKYGMKINLIPGIVLSSEAAIIGEEALLYLSEINFDIAFIGANGFTDEMGVTTPNKTERYLKRFALMNAKRGYILVDESKQGLDFIYKVANIEEFPIISNK